MRLLTAVVVYHFPLATANDHEASVSLIQGLLANRGELHDILL